MSLGRRPQSADVKKEVEEMKELFDSCENAFEVAVVVVGFVLFGIICGCVLL